jgi:hypothetical protein
MLGRSRSSIQARVRTLGLNRAPVARPETVDEQPVYEAPEQTTAEPGSRLARLLTLRDQMERNIEDEMIPIMQQPAYFREYRALLAEIDELEHRDGEDTGEGRSKLTLAESLAQLAEAQRRYLEYAALP